MFSAEYYAEIKAAFDRQMALLDERIQAMGQAQGQEKELPGRLSARLLEDRKGEILEILKNCGGDEAQAFTFLYSAMPRVCFWPMPDMGFICGIREFLPAGCRRGSLPTMCFIIE